MSWLPEEANWSGSTLFAKAGYIRVQQAKGNKNQIYSLLLQTYFAINLQFIAVY